MRFFALEHSRAAYRADFAIYGVAAAALTAYLLMTCPPGQRLAIAAMATLGMLGWTAIEYALHRFVLHGLQPFRGWHAEHHRRPAALICTPTVLSGTLIALLVLLPAWLLGVAALLLGVPLIAIAKVICDRVEALQPAGELMGR